LGWNERVGAKRGHKKGYEEAARREGEERCEEIISCFQRRRLGVRVSKAGVLGKRLVL
jgi:hypothetical protein